MLTDRNVREINRLIEAEVREYRMSFDQDEKLEAVARIRALQNLLQPQPTREELIAELAQAIVDAKPTETREPTASELFADILGAFRR